MRRRKKYHQRWKHYVRRPRMMSSWEGQGQFQVTSEMKWRRCQCKRMFQKSAHQNTNFTVPLQGIRKHILVLSPPSCLSSLPFWHHFCDLNMIRLHPMVSYCACTELRLCLWACAGSCLYMHARSSSCLYYACIAFMHCMHACMPARSDVKHTCRRLIAFMCACVCTYMSMASEM